jgi:hypothetical protein
MSYNPTADPRSGGDANEQARRQQQIDQEYARQFQNNPPVAGMYNRPVSVDRTITNTPVVARTDVDVSQLRDRVRWGPILAGLVSALATLLILGLLGVAVGLTAAAGTPGGGANAAANQANNYSTGAAIWAAVSALIAFFIGGFVAARTSAVYGKRWGWINGALVWAVTLPLLLWLAGSGASGLLNALGFNINDFTNAVSNTVNNPATNPANNPAVVQNTTETARNGAWGALIALLLGLVASALGGLAGGRTRDDWDDVNDGRTESVR